MGKDLKNREIGKGLSQRKDGRYTARFVSCTGVRKQRYFDSVVQARQWLQEARYNDKLNTVIAPFELAADNILENDASVPAFSDMTVDQWFKFWIENIVPDLRSNTLRNYRDRYRFNIQPGIGRLKVREVRPLHCKKVLLNMDEDYAGSTIKQTYITMGTVFKSALMNGVIDKHPMDGVRYTKQPKSMSDIKFLTLEEQDKFLETANRSHNNDTISSLSAYPKGTLIAIGSHGFTRKLDNREIFRNQVAIVVEVLRPSGIIVYGPVSEYIFQAAIDKGIPIYQYDSYTMKQNAKDKAEREKKKAGEVENHEGI